MQQPLAAAPPRRHQPEEFSAREGKPRDGTLAPSVNYEPSVNFSQNNFSDFNQGKIVADPPGDETHGRKFQTDFQPHGKPETVLALAS
jgi:hypothetical protein